MINNPDIREVLNKLAQGTQADSFGKWLKSSGYYDDIMAQSNQHEDDELYHQLNDLYKQYKAHTSD
jgi:hypothetical protein